MKKTSRRAETTSMTTCRNAHFRSIMRRIIVLDTILSHLVFDSHISQINRSDTDDLDQTQIEKY